VSLAEPRWHSSFQQKRWINETLQQKFVFTFCNSQKGENMKVKVFRDATGKVLASSEIGDEKVISAVPQLDKGHSAEEINAAEHYAQNLTAFYKNNAKAKK
jgi:hypothetical protein